MEDLSLESSHRSPEGVVFGEAALAEDAFILDFESFVCFDVVGIEVLDAAEQGVKALGGLKRAQQRIHFLDVPQPLLIVR